MPPTQKPDDKQQAALDKQADALDAKADDAQAKAADLAADAQKAEEKAEDYGQDAAPRCPKCRERMEKYEGANPHKQSTAVCPEHGRMQVHRNKVVGA